MISARTKGKSTQKGAFSLVDCASLVWRENKETRRTMKLEKGVYNK